MQNLSWNLDHMSVQKTYVVRFIKDNLTAI